MDVPKVPDGMTLCDNCGGEMPKVCNIRCPTCGHKHECGEH